MRKARWRAAAGWTICFATARGVRAQQNDAELAKASQNPVADLNSIPLQFNFNSGGGLGSMTSLLLNVQPVLPLPIDKTWLLVSRTIVPYVNVPIADTIRRTGIADIQEQAYFALRKPHKITFGIGPILWSPTATNNVTRTGQWALGPTGVVLAMPGPWVIGILANNIWRVGGVNHGLTVNQFTTQPFINLNLPFAWSLVTAPIITSNWSAAPDQRWT